MLHDSLVHVRKLSGEARSTFQIRFVDQLCSIHVLYCYIYDMKRYQQRPRFTEHHMSNYNSIRQHLMISCFMQYCLHRLKWVYGFVVVELLQRVRWPFLSSVWHWELPSEYGFGEALHGVFLSGIHVFIGRCEQTMTCTCRWINIVEKEKKRWRKEDEHEHTGRF